MAGVVIAVRPTTGEKDGRRNAESVSKQISLCTECTGRQMYIMDVYRVVCRSACVSTQVFCEL